MLSIRLAKNKYLSNKNQEKINLAKNLFIFLLNFYSLLIKTESASFLTRDS